MLNTTGVYRSSCTHRYPTPASWVRCGSKSHRLEVSHTGELRCGSKSHRLEVSHTSELSQVWVEVLLRSPRVHYRYTQFYMFSRFCNNIDLNRLMHEYQAFRQKKGKSTLQ